jgi:hypothetical protein
MTTLPAQHPDEPNPFRNIDVPTPGRPPRVLEIRVPAIFHVAAWLFVVIWPFVLGGCLSIKAQIVNTTFWFKFWQS